MSGIDSFGLRFRLLAGIAADMSMDHDPLINEIRAFFKANPDREVEMRQRMPTEEQIAAWVENEAREVLKVLKGEEA